MNTDTKRIAHQRVQILFRLAREVVHDRPELAQRYIEIARKVAMRARLHLPTEYRLQVCRHCKKLILPGVSCRVRVQQRRTPHIVVTCLHCGEHMRVPLKRKRGR